MKYRRIAAAVEARRPETFVEVGGPETPKRTDLENSLNTYLAQSPESERAERQIVANKIREMRSLTPTVSVDFSYLSNITALPKGFNPQGDVNLRGCRRLTSLPEGFNPQGDVDLRFCSRLMYLPEGFNPQGEVSLSGCTGLTSLPEGFNPQRNVDLSGCTGLTSLPEGFNPQGNVNLYGCRGLTSLPEGFNPQGDVCLYGCRGLTSLPEGFNPQGDVGLYGCTGLTTIPESLFNMPSTATVDLQNTGLNARVVADIIQRMNTPGYNGPRFILSVADSGYRTEAGVTAGDLPSIVSSVGHRLDHPLWTVAQSQTHIGSQWNSLAMFLTRLLNETPRSKGQVPIRLRETLGSIFTAMEREFSANSHQLDRCEFINSTLAAAQSGIGTCIDKVKVGYVMMQLQLEKVNGVPSAERNIELLGRTIELVEGINRSDYVFDRVNLRFEKVLIVGRELSDDHTSMVCTVKIDGIERQYTLAASTSDANIKQVAIAEMNTQAENRFRVFRIGDEVEDILNLTYSLPEMQSLHRIDMRFLGCRTMTEASVVDAAIRYIREVIPTRHDVQMRR